jgi:hypothetical protein
MSVINEIQRTIYAIRRTADVDVERLCFEVDRAEWEELLRWLHEQGWDQRTKGDFLWKTDHLTFMGIRVRQRPVPNRLQLKVTYDRSANRSREGRLRSQCPRLR